MHSQASSFVSSALGLEGAEGDEEASAPISSLSPSHLFNSSKKQNPLFNSLPNSNSFLITIHTSSITMENLPAWFSDAFTRDTDALTKAFNYSGNDSLFDVLDASLFDVLDASLTITPSPSPPIPATPTNFTGSGSDPDTASRRTGRRSVPGPASGRAGKRKPRASKKSPTTFITADAENFRQMVQQVTGVKFPAGGSILKPEPQRLSSSAGRAQAQGGCLPTLDTSAFLLDSAIAAPSGAEIGAADGVGIIGGLDFGSFSCFPTLDSWEVM